MIPPPPRSTLTDTLFPYTTLCRAAKKIAEFEIFRPPSPRDRNGEFDMGTTTTWVQRRLLPGLALKAVVIGGGYATGLELVTFFLPSGPVGGIYALLLAALIWSLVCAAHFLFAFHPGSRDYRHFFLLLLALFWPLYEYD